MANQSYTMSNSLIVLDLWRHHYRVLQITYQKSIKKNENHVKKEKKYQ